MSKNKEEIEKGEAKKEDTENGEIEKGDAENGEIDKGETEKGELEKGEAKEGKSKRDIEIMEAERASPRASDDEENGLTRKKLRLSEEQSAFLEESFKEHHTLIPGRKYALAKYLNLHPRQVEVWFQNKRARIKLKQTEVDCEKRCKSLTKETEREEAKRQKLSKRRIKTIGVFGGSQLGKDPEFLKAAVELGKTIASRKIHLLYGGGIEGLSASTALTANVGGTKVVSILVNGLNDWMYPIGSQLRVMTLPERMGCILYHADAFIVLPGGLEALEGISSIMYWAELNFHRKPLGLLNIKGFYDSLLSFLDLAVEHGFIPQVIRRSIISAATVNQLIGQLEDYTPEPDLRVSQIGWWPSGSNNKHEPNGNEHEPDTSLHL